MTDKLQSFDELRADYLAFRNRDFDMKADLLHALLDLSLVAGAIRSNDESEATSNTDELRKRTKALVDALNAELAELGKLRS